MSVNFKVKLGGILGILACVGQIAIEIYAASKNPDYNAISQTISYLGTLESPTYILMVIWSVLFSLLFLLFTLGFWHFFQSRFKYANLTTILLIIYGLAQGAVAGFFPMDANSNKNSLTHNIHDIFSGLGDVALVFFPLVMLFYFKGKSYVFTLIISILGIGFVLVFLSAKFKVFQSITPFSGLWQRTFQIIYFGYIMFIAFKMYFKHKTLMDKAEI